MNIFAVHSDPYLSARSLHDAHVVKMILESAQLLSAAVQIDDDISLQFLQFLTRPNNDIERVLSRIYGVTHQNHPCAIWTRQSYRNFVWLACHLDGLVAEYHHRYHKIHATDSLRWIFCQFAAFLAGVPRFYNSGPVVAPEVMVYANAAEPLPQSMPDIYKDKDYVEAYRRYYIGEKIFQSRAKWTRRSIPDWILNSIEGSPQVGCRVVELAIANLEQAG